MQLSDFSFNLDSTNFDEWINIFAFVGERWVYGSMQLPYAEINDLDPEIEEKQKAE